jgi:hypothetical protein
MMDGGKIVQKAKISKVSIGLAALLAIFIFAGIASPSIVDGIIHPSGMLVSCAADTQANGLMRVLEWAGLSLVAIMVGLMFAIIGQILTGTFSGQKYNEFIKGMIWGAVETAALLGLFIAMFGVIWPYSTENLDKARAYATLTTNTVFFDFGLMLSANMLTGFVTNMNPQFKIPAGPVFITLGVQVAPMFKPFVDILGVAMQLITTSVVMWSSQVFLLCFIKSHMLTVLLPAGFFLRGFGLKAGGNALIGIALSMYFIYPYMIILSGEVVANHLSLELAADSTPHLWGTCLDQPICCLIPGGATPNSMGESFIPNGANWQTSLSDRISPEKVNQGIFDMKFDNQVSGGMNNWCMYNTMFANAYRAFLGDTVMASGMWGLAGGVGAVTTLSIMKYFNLGWITVALMVPIALFTFYTLSDIMYFVFVLSIILPIFIIFITLTLAKEIAKVLGTEIDLSPLEKLI